MQLLENNARILTRGSPANKERQLSKRRPGLHSISGGTIVGRPVGQSTHQCIIVVADKVAGDHRRRALVGHFQMGCSCFSRAQQVVHTWPPYFVPGDFCLLILKGKV